MHAFLQMYFKHPAGMVAACSYSELHSRHRYHSVQNTGSHNVTLITSFSVNNMWYFYIIWYFGSKCKWYPTNMNLWDSAFSGSPLLFMEELFKAVFCTCIWESNSSQNLQQLICVCNSNGDWVNLRWHNLQTCVRYTAYVLWPHGFLLEIYCLISNLNLQLPVYNHCIWTNNCTVTNKSWDRFLHRNFFSWGHYVCTTRHILKMFRNSWQHRSSNHD